MRLLRPLPLLLLAAPSPLLAQEAEAAPTAPPASLDQLCAELHPLLQKATQNLERPWECELELAVDSKEGPASGTGRIVYFYQRMFSFQFAMDAGPEGAREHVELNMLADDSHVYLSVDQGDGMAMAFKVSLDLFDDGLGSLGGVVQMDGGPGLSELTEMLSAIEFREEKLEGGKTVRLESDLTALIQAEGGGPESLKLSLDLDAKHAFPRALQVDAGEEGTLRLSVSGLTFPEDMDRSRFEYKGPPAIDLTGQIEMALNANSHDEDEF